MRLHIHNYRFSAMRCVFMCSVPVLLDRRPGSPLLLSPARHESLEHQSLTETGMIGHGVVSLDDGAEQRNRWCQRKFTRSGDGSSKGSNACSSSGSTPSTFCATQHCNLRLRTPHTNTNDKCVRGSARAADVPLPTDMRLQRSIRC